MSTSTAQTTQSSTKSDSFCNSTQSRSRTNSRMTWISTLLLVWRTGQERDSLLIFTNTEDSLSSKAVWTVTRSGKLHRPTQPTPQPQGFESVMDALPTRYPFLPICNNQHSTMFSGKWRHSLCPYSTKHYGSSTWLHLLIWQATPYMSPTTTSNNMPFSLFDVQCKWERARQHQQQASSLTPIASHTYASPLTTKSSSPLPGLIHCCSCFDTDKDLRRQQKEEKNRCGCVQLSMMGFYLCLRKMLLQVKAKAKPLLRWNMKRDYGTYLT